MVKAVLPPQRALILVGELRSYKPHSTARKKVKFNLKLKKKKYIYIYIYGDFPDGPVVKTLHFALALQEAWVLSLVGELKSHVLCSAVRKLKTEN